jgi:hypothetical protein
LSPEKPIRNEAVDSARRIQLPRTAWANDCTGRQAWTDEFAWLGHDQIGLQCLWLTGREIFKYGDSQKQ